MDLLGDTITFNDLEWDTNFFGVKSAKVVLHKPLTPTQWNKLKIKLNDYEFISIVNMNSEPINSQIIGKETKAFVADVNIQFEKKIMVPQAFSSKDIQIYNSLERNNQVLDILNFQFSKFTEDPGLAERGGKHVYKHWILNAFEQLDKSFVLSKDERGNINGFLLFSYSGDVCIIELIAVSENTANRGIGSKMFNALENEAFHKGFTQIKVGTQLRNLGAINFYHKVGCKQVGCHKVYHLWNLVGG